MEGVKSMKPQAIRIILGYQEHSYKFMSFVADRTDNAFHFRLFRKNARSDGDSTEESDIIRIQLPEPAPESFDGGKLSTIDDGLTQSRIIKRMRHSAHGDPSIQSGANITILSVAPEHPSRMVEISSRDERDIHFALQGDVQPFVVNFIVHRKSSEEMPLMHQDNLMGGQLIQCKFDDLDFDLLITMLKVQADTDDGNINWPPHSVVLRRIGH